MIESTNERPTDEQRMAKAMRTIADGLRRRADQLEAMAGEADTVASRLTHATAGRIRTPIGHKERSSGDVAGSVSSNEGVKR